MADNVDVAERDTNLVCQDTGTVVFWLEVGEDCALNLARVTAAVRAGTARATLDHSLRPNAVHPVTRQNTLTNTGRHLPVMHYEFVPATSEFPGDALRLRCLPKGSGSENMSFLKMLIPADGVRGVKRFILECVVEAGPKPCPPTIVGVGLGGTSDLCAALAKKAVLRPLGSHNDDPVIAALEDELLRRRERARHRPDGSRRQHYGARRAHRARRHPHHPEPRRGEPAVLGRPPVERARHERRPRHVRLLGEVRP